MENSLIIYQTEDGQTKIDVHIDNDTVWLSLDQMSELFQRDKSTISRHIKNIFSEGELDKNSVVANFATTAADGKTYNVDYYNLDVIISVGYRVKSIQGTRFRIWANSVLKEYLIKGNKPTLAEAKTAKNYLDENELNTLNRLVSAYLDLAELQALRQKPMYMKDWIQRLDEYLKMTDSEVLENAGTVSHALAEQKAKQEYQKYKKLHSGELSLVEEAFLQSIEQERKRLKK